MYIFQKIIIRKIFRANWENFLKWEIIRLKCMNQFNKLEAQTQVTHDITIKRQICAGNTFKKKEDIKYCLFHEIRNITNNYLLDTLI
ncbi:hypothetical protein NQ315_014431 [Exocentrus adspersus]|uniref:Uncharacterized protein n=1 Tax=Exocentrus adspersus TaxID=1586481 RepID=A0AAV8VB55_9CUCU|nr:hypothetical protein NQ315_014431 [Exocentrus adspersus]